MKKMMVWITALVILDQVTKTIAHKLIPPDAPLRIFPFLEIVNLRNAGAAFGILRFLGNNFFIVISLLTIIVLLFILFRGREKPFGLGLIIAGAAGNLIDRLSRGYVRDFIDFHLGHYHWPAFNFADAYLSIGIIILFLDSLFSKKRGAA